MTDNITMRDVPMSDFDREAMREEFEGFDDMTLTEFKAAVSQKMDGILDLILSLKTRDNS